MQAVEFVGMPEARIILAQATTYPASAPKSNAAYKAVDDATSDIKEGRTLPVPEHLKNKHVKKPGDKYKYAHDYRGHYVAQEYVPTSKTYYEPTEQGYEATIGKRLDYWRSLREEAEKKSD